MNKLRIRRLGVLSFAKMQGLMGFVIGLIIGVIYGLIIIAYSLLGASLVKGDSALAIGGGGVVLGIIVIIAMPIMYGIFGFIGGAIGALIYNLFAGMVGGLEIEVENIH
jgi:hypothetical protein